MRRVMKQWAWLTASVLFLLGGVPTAWAQTNTFPASGNAGIGTTSPAGSLHINAGGNDGLLLESATGSSWALRLQNRSVATDFSKAFELFQDNSGMMHFWNGGVRDVLTLDTGGNVGVGTAAPAARLHIRTGAADGVVVETDSASPWAFRFQNRSVATDFSKAFQLLQDNQGAARIYNSGALVLFMAADGKVGIGTGSPTAMLHVIGDARVDGNLAAKYQDVAEWVPTSRPVPPGTVVVVDTKRSNYVLPSEQPYDTRVAGVVSVRPGVLLGEAGDDKVKVAQSGRVRVKVDARYGAIAAGDLLVSSPTAGYAMRSEPIAIGGTMIHRPGTLIGKALEPLEQGLGEILILLTLQ